MSCGSCGSVSGGKPMGCKSNGGCSTGGCNRMNVHDWLNSLPYHDGAKPFPIVEVSFNKGSRKEFFRNNTHHILEKSQWIVVEGVSGYDIGQVSLTGELVKLQLKKYGVTENSVTKKVFHPATEDELATLDVNKTREQEILIRSRAIAKTLNLEMKLCEVEVQADGKKGTFFYTADQRVDFRELIKLFANDFKMKIEMKQIGARQESAKVGGIGSCGRELCCSTWLTDFKSVNTTAARYQNLSINQTKLSGQCGRLKCCLNYELDTYMDALSVFPDHAEHLETQKGVAHLQKRDIFKNLMWYSFSDNNKQYPLTINRVNEIIKLNKQGQKVEDLQPVELETAAEKGIVKSGDMGFVNDVGQISLKALEKNSKKKKNNNNANRNAQQPSRGNVPNNSERRPNDQQGTSQARGNGPQQQRPQQQPNNRPKPQAQPNAKPAQQPNRPDVEKPNSGNVAARPANNKPNNQPRPQQNEGAQQPRREGGNPNNSQQQKNRPNNNGGGKHLGPKGPQKNPQPPEAPKEN